MGRGRGESEELLDFTDLVRQGSALSIHSDAEIARRALHVRQLIDSYDPMEPNGLLLDDPVLRKIVLDDEPRGSLDMIVDMIAEEIWVEDERRMLLSPAIALGIVDIESERSVAVGGRVHLTTEEGDATICGIELPTPESWRDWAPETRADFSRLKRACTDCKEIAPALLVADEGLAKAWSDDPSESLADEAEVARIREKGLAKIKQELEAGYRDGFPSDPSIFDMESTVGWAARKEAIRIAVDRFLALNAEQRFQALVATRAYESLNGHKDRSIIALLGERLLAHYGSVEAIPYPDAEALVKMLTARDCSRPSLLAHLFHSTWAEARADVVPEKGVSHTRLQMHAVLERLDSKAVTG